MVAIPNKDGAPYPFRTLLGFCIVVPITESAPSIAVAISSRHEN